MLLLCLAVLCLIGNLSCAAVPLGDTAGHGNNALLDQDDVALLTGTNNGHLNKLAAQASSGRNKNIRDPYTQAFTGLAAMAVFLALVFILTISYTLWKRSKKTKGFKHAATNEDADMKQTNF